MIHFFLPQSGFSGPPANPHKWLTERRNRPTLSVDMTSPNDIREQIIQAGRRLEARGFVAGTDGNISARLGPNRILITPTGMAKGRLTADDLVVVDFDGQRTDGRRNPSSEMGMHLAVYQQRSDIHACVHAHPPYSTAFAVAGQPLPPDILPEVVLFVGPIPLTDYAPPGTSSVADSLNPYLGSHDAFLMRSHGLLTIGKSLESAYNRHETVEHYAHILWIARQLGDWGRIPAADLARLTQQRDNGD